MARISLLLSTKSAAKPADKVAGKPAARPAAGAPIPVPPVEHVQLFKVKGSRQKKWHTEPVFSVELNMHRNSDLLCHFVVHVKKKK
jgi:hypothetical protein